jgi:hypothetical protein
MGSLPELLCDVIPTNTAEQVATSIGKFSQASPDYFRYAMEAKREKSIGSRQIRG